MNRHSTRLGFLLLALAIALGGWSYRHIQEQHLRIRKEESRTILTELATIKQLKKLWGGRGLSEKIDRLKRNLPPAAIKRFEKGRGKLRVQLSGMEGRALNRFLRAMGNLPLRIQSLEIRRQGERYDMECRCKW